MVLFKLQQAFAEDEDTDKVEELIGKTKREETKASTKVSDRVSDDPKDNTYMTYMTLNDSRLWMRVRARMMKGVKMNT